METIQSNPSQYCQDKSQGGGGGGGHSLALHNQPFIHSPTREEMVRAIKSLGKRTRQLGRTGHQPNCTVPVVMRKAALPLWGIVHARLVEDDD